MPAEFKSISVRSLPEFNTSFASVYTVPAGRTAVLISAQVANKESAQVGVQLQWKDADSASPTAPVMLADGVQVPAASAVGLLTGKIVLNSGDSLEAAQEGLTPAGALDLTVSLMEIY